MRITNDQARTIREVIAKALDTGAAANLHTVTVIQFDFFAGRIAHRSAWFDSYGAAMEYADMLHGKYEALGRWHGIYIDGDMRVHPREAAAV